LGKSALLLKSEAKTSDSKKLSNRVYVVEIPAIVSSHTAYINVGVLYSLRKKI